jgi:hypothetical protein
MDSDGPIINSLLDYLEEYLDGDIKAAGIGDFCKAPLFRSAIGRTTHR